MVTLRPYQQEALNTCLNASKGGLIIVPTGGGKSHIIAELCHALAHKSVLVLTPRIELMKQNREKIKSDTPCVTVNTAYYRKMKADIVIVDEAHLIRPHDGMYQEIISNATVIFGFTATPFRTYGGKLVGLTFKKLLFEVSRDELVSQGFLSPRTYVKAPHELLINVKTSAYTSLTQMSDEVCPQSKRCLDHYLENKKSEQALVFVCDITHAYKVHEMLPGSNLIHSKLSTQERTQIVHDFKSGKLAYLINCEILTTGFDYPALSEIVILRPTSSYSLFEQICGRGDRIYPGKIENRIYDYTINHYYFVKANKTDFFRYCIECYKATDYRLPRCQHCNARIIRGDAPIKKCIHCRSMNHPKATYCTDCGGFIKENIDYIQFNKISIKVESAKRCRIRLGESALTFPTTLEKVSRLADRLSIKVTKRYKKNNIVHLLDIAPTIAYYTFNKRVNEPVLLEILPVVISK